MSRLYLLPVGTPEHEVLGGLEKRLHQILAWEIRRHAPLPMPVTAFNAVQNQYEALHIMRAAADVIPADASRVLAVTEEDLSIPMLTFVYGQAQLRGRIALMSLARLRQEFYGMAPQSALLMTRALKEALHELGHTFGLRHCPTSSCLMAIANDIQHVDEKENDFCGGCAMLFKDALHTIEMTSEKETR
jgi:archaemetzincin